MEINFNSWCEFILPKLLFVAANFIDDLCLLLLSRLGIHLPWLQILSMVLIIGKLIHAIAKQRQSFSSNFVLDHYQKQQLQNS